MEKPPKNIGNTDVQRKLEAALFQGGCFLINHQIQSFDRFLEIDLRHLIEEEFRDVEVLPSYVGTNPTPNPGWRRANLSFQGLQIILPEWTSKEGHASHLFPDEARLRKLTYSAEIQTNIHIKVFKHCESGKLKKGKDKKNVYTDIGKGKQGLSTMNYNEKSSMGSLNGKEEEIEQEETVKNVSIGRIPVMVGSSYCRLQGCGEKVSLEKGHCAFDVGGYFIIKGSEKVLITQEEKSRRLICTSLRNGKGFHARYPLANKGMTSRISNVIVSFKYDVEKEGGFIDAPEKKPNVVARIPFFRPEINAVVLLRALGITSDRELIEIIGLDVEDTKMFDLIRPSLKSAELEMLGYLWDDEKKRPRYGNQDIKDAALLTIKKNLNSRTEESASQILDRCLFPDLGYNDLMKAMHVGYMIEQVLTCCLGRRKEDFSDSLSMRRLELAGDLLLLESKSKLFKFRRDLQRALQKALVKGGAICLQKHIVPFSLENAFSTGNWAQAPGVLTAREGGLVVPLDRANPLATLSHLRQTELSVNSRAKLLDSRYPNLSHLGRFCLVQTSDGQKCGLVKSLAFSSHVTTRSSEQPVIEALKQFSAEFLRDVQLENIKRMSKVFLNGRWIALHEDTRTLARSMRQMRRNMNLHYEVEIADDFLRKEIRISSDSGRIIRPLLIVTEGRPSGFIMDFQLKLSNKEKWTRKELLEAGIIELIGPEEEAGCIVASDLEDLKQNGHLKHFTHCEIHPALMFGVSASLIPFANHNHSLRVLHQAQKHCRQAIGYYSTYLPARADTNGQNLLYPQKPLVSTRFFDLLKRNELANGQNSIVAVCPYMGFNQEDSLIMNQSSIDRGLFNSAHYRCFSTVYKQSQEVMSKPAESDARRNNRPFFAYSKLDSDGLPGIGSYCSTGDVIFGKVSAFPENGLYKDRSITLKGCEKGRVDRVILASDDAENVVARVILREKLSPVIGDKFSSMHGQKGVLGLIVHEYDLPFTIQGMTPDVIINPHAFPSRQTVGQLLECHFAKTAAIKGKYFDGTAFNRKPITFITKELNCLGYNQWGNEKMVNGQTGELMDAKIFIGPSFYQRLTKMAERQLKYRRQGPTHPLTRQPVEDRKRHGGIRIGEMERDCLLGHGVASNIQERLFLLSDPYKVYVCQGCSTMVTKEGHKLVRICKFCKTSKHMVSLDVPYACKLLYQELLSMGVFLRLKTEHD